MCSSHCHQVPCLQRKTKVDVTKCHACHAKCAWIRATPATQSEGRCHQTPCLPRKVKVDVAKCHACHANGRGDNGGKRDPSASLEPAQCRKCHACHAKRRWMTPSATPVTEKEGVCHQVPRLPHKVERRHREPSGPPEPAQCRKCHACHAKCMWMSPSALPATQSEGRRRQVPRLPGKVERRHREPRSPPEPTQCRKCLACHCHACHCHACQ